LYPVFFKGHPNFVFSSMKQNISIVVKGTVQGVFFRASAKEKADLFGIAGFVRNEFDGSVYIEAEGNETQMLEFVSWCKQGPQLANVESCLVKKGHVVGFTEFVILR
jgi:acylphosphatase